MTAFYEALHETAILEIAPHIVGTYGVTMDVVLPPNFRLDAINKFVSQIVGQNAKPRSDRFVLDFGRLNFIDGSGYTVLSNSIEWLLHNGVTVSFRNHGRTNVLAIQYLDDCEFFLRYLGEYLRDDAEIRNTTLPCKPIEQAHAFGWLEHELSPWLSYALGVGQEKIYSTRAAIKEIINNIYDHSTINTGFIHAQHYPNMRSLKVTVSDFGAGIPSTIRTRYGAMSDNDAIKHAIKEGVTAKTLPTNWGAGLSYLVDCVLGNRGVVRFHSLTGNVTCLCDNKGKPIQNVRQGTGVYPGTLIEIELDTRLFVGDDEEERTDFEW